MKKLSEIIAKNGKKKRKNGVNIVNASKIKMQAATYVRVLLQQFNSVPYVRTASSQTKISQKQDEKVGKNCKNREKKTENRSTKERKQN